MELIDKDGTVIRHGGLTVTPHPLVLTGQRHIESDLILGETLTELLSRHIDDLDNGNWVVTLDGYEVPQHMWSRTMPKDGTMIECRAVVRKEVLYIAAIVALTWFTMGAGGMGAAGGGSFLGLTGAAGWIAAGPCIGKSIIVNKSRNKTFPSGAGNELN